MFGVKCFMHVGVVQFWNRYGQTLEDRAQVDEASICGQRECVSMFGCMNACV